MVKSRPEPQQVRQLRRHLPAVRGGHPVLLVGVFGHGEVCARKHGVDDALWYFARRGGGRGGGLLRGGGRGRGGGLLLDDGHGRRLHVVRILLLLLLLLLLGLHGVVLRGALHGGAAGGAAAVRVEVRVRVGMRGQLRRLVHAPTPVLAQFLSDGADTPARFAMDLCEYLQDLVLLAAHR